MICDSFCGIGTVSDLTREQETVTLLAAAKSAMKSRLRADEKISNAILLKPPLRLT